MNEGDGRDLVVIGGGVVGLAVARDAAQRGLSVTLVERGRPAREASWAAAGMLSPFSEALEDGPFLDFGLAALDLWSGWAQDLEDQTDRSVDYREPGKIHVAFSAGERDRLQARIPWAQHRGLAVHWLDPGELKKVEPGISDSAWGGLLVERDFSVDNRRLGQALEVGAHRAGVDIREGTTAREIRSKGGRVVGIGLEDGASIPARRVVVAAGAWSGGLEGLPRHLPVRPIRGQMLALEPGCLPSAHLLESEDVYLVPRADGRLLVGATVEGVGFRPGVTVEGVRTLLDGALGLIPGLMTAPLTELWSGFRPGTEDGNPILGPDPDLEGLFLATGHFRNGILLAPLTALVLGGLLVDQVVPEIPASFLPDRIPSRPDPTGRQAGFSQEDLTPWNQAPKR